MNHILLSINALFPRRLAAADLFLQEAAVIKSRLSCNLLEMERSLTWNEFLRELVPVRPVTCDAAAVLNGQTAAERGGKCSD